MALRANERKGDGKMKAIMMALVAALGIARYPSQLKQRLGVQ